MEKYGYTRVVDTSFLEAVDDITFSLQEQWFWVMTRIDMQSKLKEKLGRDIEEYMILWACNPELASESLDLEYEIGLLLPCNVIIYKKGEKTYISWIVPSVAMNILDNKNLWDVASKAEEKIKAAIDNM